MCLRRLENEVVDSPLIRTDRIEIDAFSNSSIVACVFVTAVTFLPHIRTHKLMGGIFEVRR
jgi:hypothetical protein